MAVLGRQMAITAALVLALWAMLEYSLCGLPAMRDYIHTSRSAISSLHHQESAQIIGDLHLLAKTDKPKIILLGASTAQDALLPQQLAPLFPGYEVHSLALSGSYGGTSIHGNTRVMEAAREMMPPAAAADSVFVFGTGLSMFDTGRYSNPGDIFDDSRALMFPRLYRRTGFGTEPRFGRSLTIAALKFMRPFFAARRSVEALREDRWTSFLGNTDIGVHVRPEGMDGRDVKLGEIFQQQHEFLLENPDIADLARNPKLLEYDDMIRYADKNRIKLVVVALPSPREMMARDPVYAEFIERLRKGVENSDKSGVVKFLNMSALLPNSAFQDAYHMHAGAAPYCAMELWEKWPYP